MASAAKLRPAKTASKAAKSTNRPAKEAAPKKAAKSAKPKKQSKAVAKKTAPQKSPTKQVKLIPDQPDWVCTWEFEQAARSGGALHIAGVDEVGRGPLFGPVVAAAVILPDDPALDHHFEGLDDSKKLTEEEREHFAAVVQRLALAWSVAEVDVETIDRINILQASRLAMRLAVESLGLEPDYLLIDGNQKIDVFCRQKTVVQGDGRSKSIAAASVIAKVHRDKLICDLDTRYPGYGLASNKGYSTPEHKRALLRLGITELHRRSFAPVAMLTGEVMELTLELDLDYEMAPED